MKFVKMDEVPEKKKGGLRDTNKYRLIEFMSLNIKVAKVDFAKDEYKNSSTCTSCLRVSIKRFGMPIDVIHRNSEVFLVRRDI